jgi:hypothetical protein
MRKRYLFLLSGAVVLACVEGSIDSADPSSGSQSGRTAPHAAGYEVWVVDQSNTNGLAHGGTLYIYDGGAIAGPTPVTPEKIDLGAGVTALCQANTGAAPVRPHMVFFSRAGSHAILSFVASGHVVVFDAATRTPVACLQSSPGLGGARQAHAAFPAPDDSYILVANQNGKLLERIDADFATNTFQWNAAAAINLVTCITPAGSLCENPVDRIDNAPICPIVASDSKHAFVTLRGGGLFVVNAKNTPMQIVAEYDNTTVHGNGCGGVQTGSHMFLDSGGGTAGNMNEFDVYRWSVGQFRRSNPPNTPAPRLLYTDDVANRDAHGMAVTTNRRYLWVADRSANIFEVFTVSSGVRMGPVQLVGPLSDDPTPDLVDVSPEGKFLFTTLRGPNPLSGDPHVSTGSTPGLAVIRLEAGGRTGEMVGIHRISNLDASNVERADPHGIRVRVIR